MDTKPNPAPLPIVLACSGCSVAGELADHTARRLHQLGAAKMSCLAGVAGRVKAIVKGVKNAPAVLMIDGCPSECGANTLRLASMENFLHLKLHEHGIPKNAPNLPDQELERITQAAQQQLKDAHCPEETPL